MVVGEGDPLPPPTPTPPLPVIDPEGEGFPGVRVAPPGVEVAHGKGEEVELGVAPPTPPLAVPPTKDPEGGPVEAENDEEVLGKPVRVIAFPPGGLPEVDIETVSEKGAEGDGGLEGVKRGVGVSEEAPVMVEVESKERVFSGVGAWEREAKGERVSVGNWEVEVVSEPPTPVIVAALVEKGVEDGVTKDDQVAREEGERLPPPPPLPSPPMEEGVPGVLETLPREGEGTGVRERVSMKGEGVKEEEGEDPS